MSRIVAGTANARDLIGLRELALALCRRSGMRSRRLENERLHEPGERLDGSTGRRRGAHRRRDRRGAADHRCATAGSSAGLQRRAGHAAEAPARTARSWIAKPRGRRARAHRHQVAQGRLQLGLRLLHRGHQGQPALVPGGLHPQADHGRTASASSRPSSRSTRRRCSARRRSAVELEYDALLRRCATRSRDEARAAS